MVQIWGEKSNLKHDIPSACGVKSLWWGLLNHWTACLALQFILCLSTFFAITIFHCWQHLCPVPILLSKISCSLLPFHLWVLDAVQSPFFFSLPDLDSSQVALIYPLLSHLHAQWSDFFVQVFFFSIFLWTSQSTFPLFHIMVGSAFLLSSSKLYHLSHFSSPNSFLPTTKFYFPFTISRFHLHPLLPGLLINISLPLWHQHPHQAVSAIVLEHIKEAQERVSPSFYPLFNQNPTVFLQVEIIWNYWNWLQVKFQRKSCQVLGFDKFNMDKYPHHFQSYTNNLFKMLIINKGFSKERAS